VSRFFARLHLVGRAACGALALTAAPLAGQQRTLLDLGGAVEVGGEAERYLRAAQLAGLLPAEPWTVRPMAVGRATGLTDAAHPWASRWVADTAAAMLSVLRPGGRITFNSAFPRSSGAGPTWTGRGATVEARGGLALHWGALRAQLAPVLFYAQNASFTLADNGLVGDDRFRDARNPQQIDLPQRFGRSAYARLDPGFSHITLALPGSEIGVSTAAQVWGPAREYPLMLSGNAGGFPHAFLGTAQPLDLRVVRVQSRLIAGRPSATDWSPMRESGLTRWATGLVVSLAPNALPGLEVGGTRFIHLSRAGGVISPSDIGRLFTAGTATATTNLPEENQLGSVFFRWAVPKAQLEVYGEYLRDDYTLEVRRALQYPDDLRAYTLGVQRVLHQSPTALRTLRWELVNGQLPPSNRGERRGNFAGGTGRPTPLYVHGGARDGHTHAGQLLGAPEAFGGAGWRAGLDRFAASGRTSLVLDRALELDWLTTARGTRDAVRPAVRYGLTAEATRFRGARELGAALGVDLTFNRNLQQGTHVPNLRAALWFRGW